MPFGLPSFSAANILGSLLFSAIGYVAYSYGKRLDKTKVMIQGGVLMGFSYFVSDTVWMYVVGTALTAWAWSSRHDA